MEQNGNKASENKIGAVMVVGGGIAGIQASLDLADSGLMVYLVESKAAIGGNMVRLDKTFPTGDCSMCMISPKLVSVGRNPNIKIITLSDVQSIEGKAGNFRAKVLKRPRFIDENKCNGCGNCTNVCPVDIANPFDCELGTRKVVAKPYPQAMPGICEITKLGHAPCKVACPAHVSAQGYIQLIKKKEYIKAVNLVRERNPLSAICGRVCSHPCEEACTRADADAPVAVKWLKRFASDKEIEMLDNGLISLPDEKTPAADAKKVGVIGAGPAGLTVANDLADKGFAVTIYEALPIGGGMLAVGIPEYRLPKKILNHEIEIIRRKGVKIIYNCKVGKDISFDRIREDNQAVFIGAGAVLGRKLGIEGEDLKGVVHATDFLRKVGLGEATDEVKGHVAVIGGGNAAVDSARSSVRKGCKVTIVYRRTRHEMPAYEEEVEAAIHEGIEIMFLAAPAKIIGENGAVKELECIKMELGEPDASGRRSPKPVKGSEFRLKVDVVIPAISQDTDFSFIDKAQVSVSKKSLITADKKTAATSLEGVFAGGDAVTGPSTVIEAVAAGKAAAESIEKYLNGEDINANRFEDTICEFPKELLPKVSDIGKKDRAAMNELPASIRKTSFIEVETGLTEEQALAECERCLNCAMCCECKECVKACDQNAINHDMKDEIIDLEVGAVILAPGYETFDPALAPEYGFGRFPNVITNLQFERILSASGPYMGEIRRPGDGKHPHSMAFIQCVGSRDCREGGDYCSAVCCMAATKEAIMAKEHAPNLDISIFYMDMRAFGKGYEPYLIRARDEAHVKYVRSMASSIVEDPDTHNLTIRYQAETGEMLEEEFEMVVLSVGLRSTDSNRALAKRLGVNVDKYGFAKTDPFDPIQTSVPGVFAIGVFSGPKDIPETVMEASAAAGAVNRILGEVRGTRTPVVVMPEERDVTGEDPRVGVIVCRCGINIANNVDVEAVKNFAKDLPNVAWCEEKMYACAQDTQQTIREAIQNNKLNRFVVASCTPRTHEPLFQQTLKEAGLNPYLFELADIREQCSWCHAGIKATATDKAKELTAMAVAKAALFEPLKQASVDIDKSALVIGGGPAGMTAALALAEQNIRTTLIEKEARLGGNLWNLKYEHDGLDIAPLRDNMIRAVTSHPNLRVITGVKPVEVNGHVGHYKTKLTNGEEIVTGAIIVASGGLPYIPTEYSYGTSKNIFTQFDMENALTSPDKPFGDNAAPTVAMIQCVGSREPEHNYCSRVCCSQAIKNSIGIKQKFPKAKIVVLYRDIRTYGILEDQYRKARELGVSFIRFDEDAKPEVNVGGDGKIKIKLHDPVLEADVSINADALVLSAGVRSEPSSSEISEALKIPRDEWGFFAEAHVKLRPVDFASEGLYLCGLAHSPKSLRESISQALATVGRAMTVLSKDSIPAAARVSVVNNDQCASCLTCMRVCPYDAPYFDEKGEVHIEAVKCQGCGICASLCPGRAIQTLGFKDNQIGALLDEVDFDKVTA